MRVLAVGGCSSGVGKTTLICRVLESLHGWGALKVSPAHRDPASPSGRVVRHGLEGSWSIVAGTDDPHSDTGRFAAAGAARVAWLRSDAEHLGAALDEALEAFAGQPGVIVEGNAPARERPPDGLVLLARAGQREVKPSAGALVARADWIVLNRERGGSTATDDEVLRGIEREMGARPGFVIDAAAPEDPGTAGFLAAIRAWARR